MTSAHNHQGYHKPRHRNRSRSRQAGFSLVEIMIAIAILGFGLVMVATMFPIAWQRARTMSEFTSQTAAVEIAHSAAKLLLHVDSPILAPYDGSSFVGDLVEDPPSSGMFLMYPDQRVHLLHMENLLVSPRGFYPQRDQPNSAASPPYLLENMAFGNWPTFFTTDFGAAQIRLEQRVYPPMRQRENVDATTGAFQNDDPTWDDTFASRRFSWVAFHRLLKPVPDPDPTTTTDDAETQCYQTFNQIFDLGCPSFLAQTREFDMYYATVKRSRVRTRYAQQDPNTAPLQDGAIATVTALPAADDVVLPTPWRVQIYIPNDLANPLAATQNDLVGVPTVVEVNTNNVTTASFVVDFFQRGTKFIDEINGAIYEVTNRRTKAGAGPDDVEAFLTLDQEITLEDISVPNLGAQQVRTVWVFPPPVEEERLGDGSPIFAGSPPVIGIDKRILSVTP